jgi:hypothetical protein
MKNLILIVAAFCSFTTVDGQGVTTAQEVANAENAFAALSKEGTTREAFLRNISDSTILFQKGKPVKGRKTWKDRSPDTSLLFWWPQFICVSSDGTMALSTGPWEWSKTKSDTASASGYFTSVWHRQEKAWELAADIGIFVAGNTSQPRVQWREIQSTKEKKSSIKSGTVSLQGFLAMDQDYNRNVKDQSRNDNQSFFTRESIIERNGFAPFLYPFESIPGWKVSYHQSGGRITGNGEFGFTYGRAVVTDGLPQEQQEQCYLRVWKIINGEWKIIIDVIGG